MKSKIRKCLNCKRYTLKEKCPVCGKTTVNPLPPRFSPIDKYGEYRRRLKNGIEICVDKYGEYRRRLKNG